MRKPLVLIVTTLCSYFVHAQNVTSATSVFNNNTVTAATNTDLPGFYSDADAEKIIAGIMNVIGLQPNFKVKTGNVANVEADIRHHQRYIIYNPDFVGQVNS